MEVFSPQKKKTDFFLGVLVAGDGYIPTRKLYWQLQTHCCKLSPIPNIAPTGPIRRTSIGFPGAQELTLELAWERSKTSCGFLNRS